MAYQLVEGPTWTCSGLNESAGLYPLRVEPAVGRLVERLLPGVITTTTGARYYGLHTLAWSVAEGEALEVDQAEDLVRRCEVVLAAASWGHAQAGAHRRRVPEAHGLGQIGNFIDESGNLDLARAAAPGGFSKGGFAGTYAAPEQRVGLLAGVWPPTKGPRARLEPLRAGLDGVVELARQERLSASEIASIGGLCPCECAEGPDGETLRAVLFEELDEDVEGDAHRQLTAVMLLEALVDGPADDVEGAFRLSHGFGGPIAGDSVQTRARRAWRAAILRNYSVNAWRHLWRWVSEQLSRDALGEVELGELLAEALEFQTVKGLLDAVPERTAGGALVPVEEELRNDPETGVALKSVMQLAIGAARLDDLAEDTRLAFIGVDNGDLGPEWFRHQLDEHASGEMRGLAHDLVGAMLRRARRVAASKMYLDTDMRPYVPTRLRDRDGVMSMIGVESDAEVSLRTWTLAQVLGALGMVDRPGDAYAISGLGRDFVARSGISEAV